MKKKAVEYSLKAEKRDSPICKVRMAQDVVDFARKFYHEDIAIYESSFIVLMNRANNVIGYAKISQGGICSTIVDIRLVAKYAIDSLASGVILVHNHPSGELKPSTQDIQLARRLKEGLKLLDVTFLDSIIITEVGYKSMNDEGLM